MDIIYVNSERPSEDLLCKRGSIVVPDIISVVERPSFVVIGYAALPHSSLPLPAEAELNFRNLETPMVPTLGSHVAAQ